MSNEFTLDGYTFLYLPGPGGYSGYNPQRRRADVKTLSSRVGLDWGIVDEDLVLVLQSDAVSEAEFLSVQGRYIASQADGTPHRYTFDDPDRDYEVEIIQCDGVPYMQVMRRKVRVGLKVLSVGS